MANIEQQPHETPQAFRQSHVSRALSPANTLPLPSRETRRSPRFQDEVFNYSSYVSSRVRRSSTGFKVRSPPLDWGNPKLNLPCPGHGRVGIFHAIPPRRDRPQNTLRELYYQALSLKDLEDYFRMTYEAGDGVLFRIFHVQNAPWALHFLEKKFHVGRNLAGADFLEHVRYKMEDPGGKPYLIGKSWPLQEDSESGTRQMYLSFDYFREYHVNDPLGANENRGAGRVMELNHYDETGHPSYGYDLVVQRVSCFFQHKGTIDGRGSQDQKQSGTRPNVSVPLEQPDPQAWDDGDVAVIYEESKSHNVEDTLIPARKAAEKVWRRLCKDTTYDEKRELEDVYFYPKFVRTVLDETFNHLTRSWDRFLDLASEHQTILENKIYERPADESRAQELWRNSDQWLRTQKLMVQHLNLCKILKTHADALTADVKITSDINFFEEAPRELERLNEILRTSLVKSTENLINLLYQSVAIRDSRYSIEVSSSMARLSWITFFFLPLTAVASFFGMNVTWLKDYPPIKWYGIIVASLAGLIFFIWIAIRIFQSWYTHSPHQRGIYESLYHDLAVEHPAMWSRVGPRRDVKPLKVTDRLKWALIKLWANPENTIAYPIGKDYDDGDLPVWTRFRNFLIRRWTHQIQLSKSRRAQHIETGFELTHHHPAQHNVEPRIQPPTIESIMNTPEMNNVDPALDMTIRGRPLTQQEHHHRHNHTKTIRQRNRSVSVTVSPPQPPSFVTATSAASSPDPPTTSIIISEEERADHIARCARQREPWGWTANDEQHTPDHNHSTDCSPSNLANNNDTLNDEVDNNNDDDMQIFTTHPQPLKPQSRTSPIPQTTTATTTTREAPSPFSSPSTPSPTPPPPPHSSPTTRPFAAPRPSPLHTVDSGVSLSPLSRDPLSATDFEERDTTHEMEGQAQQQQQQQQQQEEDEESLDKDVKDEEVNQEAELKGLGLRSWN